MPGDLRQIALHEAAHVVAAFLFSRPIASVSVVADSETSGRAQIKTLRAPSFDEALVDIQIRLVGDIAAGTYPTPVVLDDQADESQAVDIALKVAASDPLEVLPVVELGRARARALVHRPDFRICLRALWPALLVEREMDGDRVASILREALEEGS